MARTKIRPTVKGQVTLPVAVRRQLRVTPETLLDVSVENEKIVLRPIYLNEVDVDTRIYTSEEIDEFLAADKISAEDAAFFKQILKRA